MYQDREFNELLERSLDRACRRLMGQFEFGLDQPAVDVLVKINYSIVELSPNKECWVVNRSRMSTDELWSYANTVLRLKGLQPIRRMAPGKK